MESTGAGIESRTSEGTQLASENVAVVQSLYEAYARGDLETIFSLLDSEIEVYQSSRLPWGGTYKGLEGFGAFIGKLTEHIESRVTTERFIDDQEGHVVSVGYTRGRALATGKEFDVPEAHVWTVKDGKLVRYESYIDTWRMREVLGL